MGLTLSVSTSAGADATATVLSVGGEVDIRTAPELRDALAGIIGTEPSGDVLIDLTGTGFLDSSALGVLVGANKRFDGTGARLKLVCPKTRLRKIFEISHLDEVLSIYDDLESALI